MALAPFEESKKQHGLPFLLFFKCIFFPSCRETGPESFEKVGSPPSFSR
jgi:hypothetical protein